MVDDSAVSSSPDGCGDLYDVIVIGLGFGGIYGVHRYREMGLKVLGIEAASDVGGVWHHNRYPGARCDVRSIDYSYSFSEELQQEWEWPETFSAQPDILKYIHHVVDRFDLRGNMLFDTRVTASRYDAKTNVWQVTTATGGSFKTRFLVLATGCLSSPKKPDFPGLVDFRGEWYQTSRWPTTAVSFAGKRVGIIGTGSSGVQAIPVIAAEAKSLTVFQRTPVFTSPAGNGPMDQQALAEIKARYPEYRREMKANRAGNFINSTGKPFDQATPEEHRLNLQEFWDRGGLGLGGCIQDSLVNQQANDFMAEFVRDKIREIVDDPEVAARLMPHDHAIGSRRPCIDTNYYQTFNRANVTLVDVRTDPIERITPGGIQTSCGHHDLDAIVFAIGFDAFTGPIAAIDLRNDKAENLIDVWREGPRTYLGLMTARFPNLFIVTGPNSPSVLANMILAVEHDIDWIAQTIADLDERSLARIEATEQAQERWVAEVAAAASKTLYYGANSWYMGANIEGKARAFLPYIGGFNVFRERCQAVVANDYEGFALS